MALLLCDYDYNPIYDDVPCRITCPCGEPFSSTGAFHRHVGAARGQDASQQHSSTYMRNPDKPCTHYMYRCCPFGDESGCRDEWLGPTGALDGLVEAHCEEAHTCPVCDARVARPLDCAREHYVDARFVAGESGESERFKKCSVCECVVHAAHAETHMRGHRLSSTALSLRRRCHSINILERMRCIHHYTPNEDDLNWAIRAVARFWNSPRGRGYTAPI